MVDNWQLINLTADRSSGQSSIIRESSWMVRKARVRAHSLLYYSIVLHTMTSRKKPNLQPGTERGGVSPAARCVPRHVAINSQPKLRRGTKIHLQHDTRPWF